MIRYAIKRSIILLIPLMLIVIKVVTGETACDDPGTDPSGSMFLDPCA